jgi:NAD-dependent dihydropyrimidine dehydrogenase PreA subunit
MEFGFRVWRDLRLIDLVLGGFGFRGLGARCRGVGSGFSEASKVMTCFGCWICMTRCGVQGIRWIKAIFI